MWITVLLNTQNHKNFVCRYPHLLKLLHNWLLDTGLVISKTPDKGMAESLGNFIGDVNYWFESNCPKGNFPTKQTYGMNTGCCNSHKT